MDGILLIDKPEGFTSFDVVAKARGMIGQRQVGHAGTLDPMATGVLPVFAGRATKAINLLPDNRKRYRARFRLGITTDTQDITGTVLNELPATIGVQELQQALEQFRGEIQQLPPMYSAVKVNGKRLYDLARKGIEVERKPRLAVVEELHYCGCTGPDEYEIDVLCSSGTYIRTLCHDLGAMLGCGAALTYLRRTMAAGFLLEDCITLQEAQQLCSQGVLHEAMLPVEAVFSPLPGIVINDHNMQKFLNGIRIPLLSPGEAVAGRYRIYGSGNRFLGVADVDRESGILKSRKLFCKGESI